MLTRRLLLIPALVTLLAASACRKTEIVSYRVPKEAAPAASNTAAPAGADMATTSVPTANGGELTWSAPATWQSRPATAMRKATFFIPGPAAGEQSELAVTAFPGDVGGLLANVNRWRGQLQLPPIEAAALPTALSHLDLNGLHAELIELIGPEAAERKRVLGAIIPAIGATWFFKLSGPDALVAAQKADFLAFLQTVKTR